MTSPLGAMNDANVEQRESPLLKFLKPVSTVLEMFVDASDFELNDFEDGLEDASSIDLDAESGSYEFPC